VLKQSPQLDRVFQALADPSRRLMVERLTEGPASVSDLASLLPMTMPGALQHLKVLEQSGLVGSRKVGRVRTYRIKPNVLQPAERWIRERRAGWERHLDNLGDYLGE